MSAWILDQARNDGCVMPGRSPPLWIADQVRNDVTRAARPVDSRLRGNDGAGGTVLLSLRPLTSGLRIKPAMTCVACLPPTRE